MLTKNEINDLLKNDPDLVVNMLFANQQRLNLLLEMLVELNQEMLRVKYKELVKQKVSSHIYL